MAGALLPPQAKIVIRELLPNGLRESISKVRSSVAYAVSAIAHWDWPEAWPQLFNLLMEMLVSGDLNAVHGAMRVLTGTSGLGSPVTSVLVGLSLLPPVCRLHTCFSRGVRGLAASAATRPYHFGQSRGVVAKHARFSSRAAFTLTRVSLHEKLRQP